MVGNVILPTIEVYIFVAFDAENREKYWRLGQFVKKLQYTLMLYPIISFIPVPYIKALPSLQWIQSWPKGYWELINLVDGKGENLFLIRTGTLYRYVRQLFTRCTKRWISSMFFAVCDCIKLWSWIANQARGLGQDSAAHSQTVFFVTEFSERVFTAHTRAHFYKPLCNATHYALGLRIPKLCQQ